jgi:hypothetical protein
LTDQPGSEARLIPDEMDEDEAEVDAAMVVDDSINDEVDHIVQDEAGAVHPADNGIAEDDIDIENEAEAPAPTRPTRQAAREATKRISLDKARLARAFDTDDDDDEDEDEGMMEVDAGPSGNKVQKNEKGKAKGKGRAKTITQADDLGDEAGGQSSKSANKGKGKSKTSEVKEEPETDAESEFEDPEHKATKPDRGKDVKPEGKKKKVILAKAVYWKDIPKWKRGDGSYLMQMPAEIMDEIFGLRDNLGVSTRDSSRTRRRNRRLIR